MIERRPYLDLMSRNDFEATRSVPKTPRQMVIENTQLGNPSFVARMVVKYKENFSDAEKRQFIAEAALADYKYAQMMDETTLVNETYLRSKKQKERTFRNSKKEGKALIKQIKSSYSSARHIYTA